MKKNKIISSLLVLVMLLSQAVFVFAEDTEAVKAKVYEEDINVMTALGFMSQVDTANEDVLVTKGAFAAMLLDMLNIEASSGLQSPFPDVTPSTSYYDEICTAAANGIVHGDETPKFSPDSYVTYKDAATMLVNALGYHKYAIYEGGYYKGYTKVAASIDLNKGVKVSENEKLSVGMAARMLLNAGNADMVNLTPYKDSYKMETVGTLFMEKHNIGKNEGIVNANEYTSLDSSKGVGRNRIKIGDNICEVYYTTQNSDYLGYNVDFYYRDNENGEYILLYMQPKKTNVVVADSDDIIDYKNNEISYTGENGGKKKLKLKSDFAIIYNGVYTIDYYLNKDTADERSVLLPENGEIKWIDNDRDGKAEVVSVLDYSNIVVSTVDIINQIVYDKYDKNVNLDYSTTTEEAEETIDWVITDIEGKPYGFEELAQGNVLSYAKSLDGKMLRGVVSTQTASGTLSGIRDSGGRTKLTVNGTVYTLANAKNKSELPSVGSVVSLSLDYMGKVAYAETQKSGKPGYAFVMRKYLGDSKDTYYLRLLTSDNQKLDYPLAKTVKIDGVSYKSNKLKTYMSSFAEYQLIICDFNANGEISSIDTEADVKGGAGDVLRGLQEDWTSMTWYTDSQTFAEFMAMETSAVVFKVPTKNGDYRYDDSKYAVASIPNVQETYNARGFVSDDDSIVAECVVYVSESNGNITYESPYMLISEITTGLNADDEVTTVITGYNASKDPVSYSVSTEYPETVSTPQIGKADIANLEPGDIIKYALDADDEIAMISPLYYVGEEGLHSTTWAGWFSRADFSAHMGYLFTKQDKFYGSVKTKDKLTPTLKSPDEIIKLRDDVVIYYISNYGDNNNGRDIIVDKYDVNTFKNIPDYKSSGQMHQFLAVRGGGKAKVMYIYD